MKKFLGSKLFVILTPILIFALGIGAGVLLGFQPSVSGKVSGWSGTYGGSTSGSTGTVYIFRIETAIGYWILALICAVIVLLLCIVIKNHYAPKEKDSNSNKEEL